MTEDSVACHPERWQDERPVFLPVREEVQGIRLV